MLCVFLGIVWVWGRGDKLGLGCLDPCLKRTKVCINEELGARGVPGSEHKEELTEFTGV